MMRDRAPRGRSARGITQRPAAGLGLLGVACLLVAGCARDNGSLRTAFHRFWGFTPASVATAVREAPRSAVNSVGQLVERVKPDEAWAADPFLAATLADGTADASVDAGTGDSSSAEVETASADAAGGGVMLVQNPPVVNEISSADAPDPSAAAPASPFAGMGPTDPAAGAPAAGNPSAGNENPFAGTEPPPASPLVQLRDALDNEKSGAAAPQPPRIAPAAAREEIARLMLACRQEMRRGEYAIALRVALVAEQLADTAGVFFGPDEEQPGDVVVQLRDRLAFEAALKQKGAAGPTDTQEASSEPVADSPAEVPGSALADGNPTDVQPADVAPVSPMMSPTTEFPPVATDVGSTPEAGSAAEVATAAPGVEMPDGDAPGIEAPGTEAPDGWAPETPGARPSPSAPLARMTGPGAGWQPLIDPAPSELPTTLPEATVAASPATEPPGEPMTTEPEGDGTDAPSAGVVKGPEAVVIAPMPPESPASRPSDMASDTPPTEARIAVRDDFTATVSDTPAPLISPPTSEGMVSADAADTAAAFRRTPSARVMANQGASVGPVVPEPLTSPAVVTTGSVTGPALTSAPPLAPPRHDTIAAVTLVPPTAPPPPLPQETLSGRPYNFLYGPADGAGAPHNSPPVPDLTWSEDVEPAPAESSSPMAWLLPTFAGAAIVLLTILALRRR